jgi:hypothetical protein
MNRIDQLLKRNQKYFLNGKFLLLFGLLILSLIGYLLWWFFHSVSPIAVSNTTSDYAKAVEKKGDKVDEMVIQKTVSVSRGRWIDTGLRISPHYRVSAFALEPDTPFTLSIEDFITEAKFNPDNRSFDAAILNGTKQTNRVYVKTPEKTTEPLQVALVFTPLTKEEQARFNPPTTMKQNLLLIVGTFAVIALWSLLVWRSVKL